MPKKPPEHNLAFREELNVAHKGLVSIQREIPKGFATWTKLFDRDGVPSQVVCKALPEYGVPHGIDNDVLLAVQEAFLEQGCPADDRVRLTMYRLLQLCNMDDDGDRRQDVRRSLDRMRSTTYWVSELWRAHGSDGRAHWATVTFNLIAGLAYDRDVNDPEGARHLMITLPPEVAMSLRNGYLKPVRGALLRQLAQPARGAYRVLDALRHHPEEPERRVSVLQINLMELADRFGLTSDRPEIIRRSLSAIHRDLMQVGYIANVELSGRGRNQTVSYVFADRAPDADPRLVNMLMEVGLTRGPAEKLAAEAPELVEEGVALARALLSSEYRSRVRNKGALIVDVVRNVRTGKYEWPEGKAAPRVIEAGRARVEERVRAREVPEVQEELIPLSDEDLARTVAMLLSMPKDELARLPRVTLEDLKRSSLGKSASARKLVAESARAMLSVLPA